ASRGATALGQGHPPTSAGKAVLTQAGANINGPWGTERFRCRATSRVSTAAANIVPSTAANETAPVTRPRLPASLTSPAPNDPGSTTRTNRYAPANSSAPTRAGSARAGCWQAINPTSAAATG